MTHAVKSASVRIGLSLLLGVALGSTGCILPDQLSRLETDVAAVQQQLRRVQLDQSDLQEQLAQRDSGPDVPGAAIDREELADIQFRLQQLSREMAISGERMNDIDQRLDRYSLNRQQPRPSGSPIPPEPNRLPPGNSPDSAPYRAPSAGPSGALPDPEALYNTAYADFSKGNYALAISGFQEYHERFSDSALADNALYWIAECHFSQGDFRAAVTALDRLLDSYSGSDKAPAANLKKALAFLEQNQVGQAIVQLRYVVSAFPETDEARLARDKLASLGAAPRG